MSDLIREKEAVRKAREAWDTGFPEWDKDYRTITPETFFPFMRILQNRLAAWQGRNFGAQEPYIMALGLGEEVGELQHAMLKHIQKIRGMEDPETFRAAAGDAAADIFIYLVNFLTALRIDAGTLFVETAERVMARDFRKDAKNGGE